MKKLNLKDFKSNAIKPKALFTIKGGGITTLNGQAGGDNIVGDHMYVPDEMCYSPYTGKWSNWSLEIRKKETVKYYKLGELNNNVGENT